ncbi:MAG: hypothetical protein H8D23_27150, partial [Candidatus Brocadiales bacterium]|nr:hypothetical protein [Candidatus Brocadiales bacterium]
MEQIDAIAMGESKDDIQDVQKKLNKYNAKIAGYNKVIDRASGIVRAVKDHPDAGKDYFLKKMTETRHDFIEKLETKDEKTVQKLRAIQLWDEQNPISWKAVATDPAQWISKGLAHAAPSLITIAGASQLGGPLGGIGAAVSMETGGYYASHVDELMQKELVPAHELEALKGLYQGMADEYIAEQKKFQELYPDIQHAPLPDPGVLAREMFFENYEQDENGNIWTKALTSSEAHDAIVGQAVLYGAVSGILEYLPFGRFVNAMGKGLTGTMKKTAMRNFMAIKSAKKFFGAGSATAKWMAGQSVLEMGTEMSQRVAEMVIESGGDVAFNEIWNDNELWESGWAGLMAGFFMAGIAGPSVHKKMKAYQHDQELIEEMQAIGMQMQLGNMSPAEALLEFDKKILERSKNWLANIRASGNEGLFKTMKGLFKKAPEVKLKGSGTYMGSDFRDALFDIPKSLRVLELDKQTDKKTLEAFKEKFTELTNAEEVSIDDMIKLKDELSTLVNAKDGPLSRVEEKYSKEIEKMYPKPEEVKVEEGAESGPDPPEITPTDERPQKEKEAEEKEYVTALISGKGVERLSPPNPKFKLKSHVHKHQEKTDTGEKVLEFIAFKGKADYFKEMGKEESARADRYIANFVKEKMGMEMSENQIEQIKDMYARGFFPDGIQSLEKEMKLDRKQQKEFLNWFAGNIEDMTQPDKEQHIGQFTSYYSGQFDPSDILDAFDIIPMGSDMAKEMVDEYVAQQEQEMQEAAEEGLEVLPEEGGAVQEWVGKVDKSQSNAAKELGKKSATEIQKIIDEFQDAGHELDFSKAPKTSKGKLNWGKKKQIVGALVYNIAQIKRADQAIVVPKKEGSESKPTKVGQPKVVEEQIADIKKRRQEELNSFLTPNTGNKNTSIAWSFENNNTGQTVNVKQDKNVEELENTEWEVRRSETQGDGTQLVVERKMFKSRTEALEYANMRASHTQGNNTSRKSYNQEINDKYDAEIIEEVKKGNISLNEAKDIIGSRWLEKYDAELKELKSTQQTGEVQLPKVSKEIPFSYGNNKELILNGDKTITSRNFKFIPNLRPGESGIQTVDGVDFKVTYHGELKHSEVKGKTGVEYSEGEAFAKTTKGAPTEKATVDFINGKGTKHIYQFSKIQPTQQASEVKKGISDLFESNAELDALNNTETKGDIRFKDTIKRYPDISKTLLNQINNQNIPINDTDHDLAFGERVNYKNLIDNGILRVEKTFKQEKNMPQFAKVSLTEKGRNLMFDAIDEMKGSNWKQEVYSKVINEVNNLLSKEETARKALETKKEIKPADKQQDDKEIKSGVSELF